MPEELKSQAPEILVDNEREIIEKIVSRKKSIAAGRSVYERQWLINIAFLYGKQYFAVEKRPLAGLEERIYWEIKNLERKKKTRRVANYILPLYRSLLARMLMMKTAINVEPTTRSERDVASAKVAQEVLEDFWQMVNKTNPILSQDYAGMLQILYKLFSYLLTLGEGYLKPFFNPNSTAKVQIGGIIDDFSVGCVETEVIHNFDIFPDPMRRFIIQQKILSVEDIYNLYGVEVEPEDIGLSDIERQLMNLLESSKTIKYENACRLYESWELPSKKYPQGRFILTTEKKLILDEVIPPEYKGRLPYFKFNYLDVMLAPFSQGMVEQLINLQEEYNFTISRLAEYKKWFAGKLKVPKNCKLETKYDDEVGQIIKYDAAFGEPHFETPPPPPTFLMEEVMRIRRDMEDIAARHDTSIGRIPQQAKSGIAISNLSELDDSQLAPILINIEQKLAFFAETVLDIIEKRYTEPRILSITGETLGAEVKTFKGEDVKGNRRIKISLGSSLPVSKEARQNLIMSLADRGYITKEKAMELMEFGDIEGLYHNVDEQAAKTENKEMLQGIYPEPQSYDEHSRHIKVLTDFMKSELYKQQPPEIQELFRQHLAAHQEFLRSEMQAAQQMQGGQ